MKLCSRQRHCCANFECSPLTVRWQELAKRADEVEVLRGEVATWRNKVGTAADKRSGDERHQPLLPSRERNDLDPPLASFLRKVSH